MDHLKRVTEEFRRQAETFDTFAQKTDENVAARFSAAIGDAGRTDIVNDPVRAEPIRVVVQTLAEAGRSAGMGLSIKGNAIVFFHRWRLVRARKPLGH